MQTLILVVLFLVTTPGLAATTYVIDRNGNQQPVYNTMEHQQPGIYDNYQKLRKQQNQEQQEQYYRHKNIFQRLFGS